MGANLDVREIHDGMSRLLYRGIWIQKFPFDYAMYQMIINEVRPDLIIEIGTLHGGSALYFADLLDIMGIEGAEVHTIDVTTLDGRKQLEIDYDYYKVNPQENTNYPEIVASNPRIKFFTDGYKNYDLANCEGFKRILVIDDGSHIYDDVIGAMEKFKDVVSIGSYLIVEDGNALDYRIPIPEYMRNSYKGGPLRAIYKFLAQNDGFRIDFKWCDMFGINSTFNTYGYLKKIK